MTSSPRNAQAIDFTEGRLGDNDSYNPDQLRPGLGLDQYAINCLDQRGKAVGSIVPLSVDEESWGPVDAAPYAAAEVCSNMRLEFLRSECLAQLLRIEVQLFSKLKEERIPQPILILVQQVVHFPELVMGIRKFGCLRSWLRIGMHLAQWK